MGICNTEYVCPAYFFQCFSLLKWKPDPFGQSKLLIFPFSTFFLYLSLKKRKELQSANEALIFSPCFHIDEMRWEMKILRLCGCVPIHHCRECRDAVAEKCHRSMMDSCGLRVCTSMCGAQCLLSLVHMAVKILWKFSYLEIIQCTGNVTPSMVLGPAFVFWDSPEGLGSFWALPAPSWVPAWIRRDV